MLRIRLPAGKSVTVTHGGETLVITAEPKDGLRFAGPKSFDITRQDAKVKGPKTEAETTNIEGTKDA